jgi:hypothetical protein
MGLNMEEYVQYRISGSAGGRTRVGRTFNRRFTSLDLTNQNVFASFSNVKAEAFINTTSLYYTQLFLSENLKLGCPMR